MTRQQDNDDSVYDNDDGNGIENDETKQYIIKTYI